MEEKIIIKKVPDKEYAAYDRTGSDILNITEDKLELKLRDLKNSIENVSNIFCYLGMIITIIVVLATTDFKNYILPAEYWQAIFIVALIFLGVYLFRSIFNFLINKKDIKSVIQDIKDGK